MALGSQAYTIQDNAGNAIAGVTVTVYRIGVYTKATIYSDGIGSLLDNPMTSDNAGLVTFFGVAGKFDVRFFKDGYQDQWARGVVIANNVNTASIVITLSDAPDLNAGDIIKSALRKIRAYKPGEVIDAAEVTDNLSVLNDLIDMLSVDDLMIPSSTTEVFTLTEGQYMYTIGPGGDFDTTLPEEIDARSSFSRDPFGVDYPLEPMTEREYNRIAIKSNMSGFNYADGTYYANGSIYVNGRAIDSIPFRIWYDQQFPIGRLWFYPPPIAGFTLFLVSTKALTSYDDISQAVVLPTGYRTMLIYNLAVMLADEYGKPITAGVGTIAKESRNQLQHQNAKPIMANLSNVPSGSRRRGWSKSNFLSGD
jgi:hypothetical protein